MFTGQFEHSIDEKGRITIPSRFRELLEGGGYLLNGLDGNLIITTTASFQKIAEQLNAMNWTDPTTRILRRLFISSAVPLEFDKLGRIVIPPPLREEAGLENSVYLVGTISSLEIWAAKRWNEQRNRQQEPEIAQKIAELHISF